MLLLEAPTEICKKLLTSQVWRLIRDPPLAFLSDYDFARPARQVAYGRFAVGGDVREPHHRRKS